MRVKYIRRIYKEHNSAFPFPIDFKQRYLNLKPFIISANLLFLSIQFNKQIFFQPKYISMNTNRVGFQKYKTF